ncbi:hypothetical protein JZU46_00305 [bacterium]|nr:hypothetical protein [bacterium]
MVLKVKENEAKLMYELSKLTNTTKQITTDFLESVVLFLFREYIKKHPKKDLLLEEFMDNWEASIIFQKELEIETIISQFSSMQDLAVGSYIANSENLDLYKKDVRLLKEILTMSLSSDND